MNTNYNNDVAGALKLITVNGSVYQLGKDAGNSEGGILKLFKGTNAFETYKAATDGAYDAKTVYNAISSIASSVEGNAQTAEDIADIQASIGEGFDENFTVADAIAAAKTVVAKASGESYLNVAQTTGADGQAVYTLSTTGIDSAISTAVAAVVNNAPAAFDTLKEIADWITADNSGAAAILADVANKADKVSNATNGNFAGVDGNGNLTDSGYSYSDFQAVGNYKIVQTAVSDPTVGNSTATYEFIASVSQNTNGEITATKQAVRSASASQSGLMSSSDYSKLAAISASVSGDTLTIVTQAQS